MRVGTIRSVARALGASVDLAPRWRGPELDRLLDAAHAALVEAAVKELRRLGWTVVVEWSFNHFGDRGSVDVLAWRDDRRALLVSEVKSIVVDTLEIHAGMDRKVRVARLLLPKERGWHPLVVARVQILPASSTSYDVLRRHGATFGAALAARTTDVRRWLADPQGDLAGIWFVRDTAGGGKPDVNVLGRGRRDR